MLGLAAACTELVPPSAPGQQIKDGWKQEGWSKMLLACWSQDKFLPFQ